MLACHGSGRTALWWACSRGFDDVAALLLQSQADARSTCTSGDTALQAAREAGSRKCIALLHVRRRGGSGFERVHAVVEALCCGLGRACHVRVGSIRDAGILIARFILDLSWTPVRVCRRRSVCMCCSGSTR
jgi:hypothetical protein